MKARATRFAEAFIASLGIMAFGWVSIPVVGHMAGVQITAHQGAVMSAWFFVLRFAWLYALRELFSKVEHATRSTHHSGN